MMIRVQCKECKTEYRISNVLFLGYNSYIDVLVEPDCECFNESEDESELRDDIRNLEDEVEEAYKDKNRMAKELERSLWILENAKRPKWRRRYKALVKEVASFKDIAAIALEDKAIAENTIDKVKKDCEDEMAQLIANNNLVVDGLDIRYKELSIEHKKLVFEYDKLRSQMNGGKYERSVDL